MHLNNDILLHFQMDGDDQGLEDGPQPGGDGCGDERRPGQEGAEEHLEIVSGKRGKIDFLAPFSNLSCVSVAPHSLHWVSPLFEMLPLCVGYSIHRGSCSTNPQRRLFQTVSQTSGFTALSS